MGNNGNNKRLVKNTFYLYIRMAFLMCIGLYTSRVVLSTLGFSDYGLYNLVGSIVVIFGFLNASLSSSTQRFLNVEIAKGEDGDTKKIFSNSLFIHLTLAIIILLLAETVGLWYLKSKAVIEADRLVAAMWVYQFSVITACVQIVQLPFMATLIAHERMNAFAYISIYEGIAKLSIVYLIQIMNYDKLILYGFFILCVHVSIIAFYNIYCQQHFKEARFRIAVDKPVIKEMLGFSGWNLVGNLAYACNTQGLNIVLNAFFGTLLNAARGVAFQVQGLVTQFTNNFQLAVRPQVIKYYAAGQLKEMENLVINSAKYSAFIMLIFVVPIVICSKLLLGLWLGAYPEYAPIFITIILLRCVVTTITNNIVMVVHASGYLRNIGIVCGGLLLLVLPLSYLALKLGCDPAVVFVIDLVAAICDAMVELYFMRKYIKFPMLRFCKDVYLKVLLIAVILFSFTLFVYRLTDSLSNFVQLILVFVLSIAFSLTIIYTIGLDKETRIKVKLFVKNKIRH